MNQRLSGYPSGLLALLGSQSFGEAPKELGDVIAPIIDTSSLYLLTAQSAAVQIIAAPANGINAGLRVPQGEIWRCHVVGGLCISNAGNTLDWTLAFESQGGVGPLSDTISQVASTTRWIASKAGPFWLRAGEQIAPYISALVGVPVSMSITALVSRLRA